MNKNNIFLFSPGGYGPYSRIHFWGDHIEAEGNEADNDADNDEWTDAAHNYVDDHNHDVDYGVWFMSRKELENLVETLKKLLEE